MTRAGWIRRIEDKPGRGIQTGRPRANIANSETERETFPEKQASAGAWGRDELNSTELTLTYRVLEEVLIRHRLEKLTLQSRQAQEAGKN